MQYSHVVSEVASEPCPSTTASTSTAQFNSFAFDFTDTFQTNTLSSWNYTAGNPTNVNYLTQPFPFDPTWSSTPTFDAQTDSLSMASPSQFQTFPLSPPASSHSTGYPVESPSYHYASPSNAAQRAPSSSPNGLSFVNPLPTPPTQSIPIPSTSTLVGIINYGFGDNVDHCQSQIPPPIQYVAPQTTGSSASAAQGPRSTSSPSSVSTSLILWQMTAS